MYTAKDLNTLAFMATLDAVEQKRLNKIAEFWDFYLGDQWDIMREAGEEPITVNYAKAIVDKSVSFLFGKGFKILPHKNLSDKLKPLVEEIWDYNNREVLGVEIGQMGGITGDVFVKTAWEDAEKNDEDEFYDEAYPEGKVRISVLPTSAVFPEFYSHDKDRMTKCTIKYVVVDIDERGKPKGRLYTEEITRDTITTYLDEVEQESIKNELREINVTHIKNIPLAGHEYGQSDLTSIVPLQKEINAKITDVSDIINYHAAPITIIQGAKTKNLEKGAKKVWGGIPKDAKIFNLELNSDLNASNAFVKSLKTALHELSNTPEDSLGSTQPISNTSGVALQIKYAPLLEKTWIKHQTYGKGLRDITRHALKLLAIKGNDDVKTTLSEIMSDKESIRHLHKMKVNFPDPLPKDEMVQLQLIAQKMNMGIEEPYGALEELGFEGNIEEKLEKVREYQQQQEDMAYDMDRKRVGGEIEEDIGGVVEDFDGDIGDEDIEE